MSWTVAIPLAVILIAIAVAVMSRSRAIASANGVLRDLHSRPSYHGVYSFLWTFLIGLAVFTGLYFASAQYIDADLTALVQANKPDSIRIEQQLIVSDAIAIAEGGVASQNDELRQLVAARYAELAQLRVYGIAALAIGLALVAAIWTYMQSGVSFRARNRSERIIRSILWTCAALAVLTTIGIVLSLVEQTYVFFTRIDWQVDNFFFGTTWSPLAGVHTGIMEPDKVGWLPLITGTLMITMIALLVAVPIGLMAAIYLADYASPSVRSVAKPVLEILAGIPTVVYGFFAAITVAPVIRGAGESLGLSVASESALAAGIVMGIMIIPFISSLSDDVLNAVPQSLRDGSYGLGATKAETIRRVVLPAALPGIISAVILAFSRAVGETMIVVMAAGQGPNLTWNPLEAVTTVTVQIVLLIVGDAEADFAGPPAFTLGFALFTVTLVLNIIALRIVRKYRELYD